MTVEDPDKMGIFEPLTIDYFIPRQKEGHSLQQGISKLKKYPYPSIHRNVLLYGLFDIFITVERCGTFFSEMKRTHSIPVALENANLVG